jgi:histidine triad (HIT) family protein
MTSQGSSALSYYRAMAANDRCLFCRIASGEITAKKVFEDDLVVAFNDINPQAPTHVLVIPRQHISTLDDLDEEEAGIVGMTLVRVSQIARNLHLNSEGYRVVTNHGEAAGQTVFHIHFHLLGGRNLGWPPG